MGIRRIGASLAALVCAAGLLAFTATVEAAPRASALGPEVAMAEPSGGFVGKLKASPSHGPAGTPVAVSGDGFPAEQEFELVWRTVKGRWKVTPAEFHGREFTPVAYRIATVRSDKSGRVAANFVAPEDFGFMHDVVVQQGNRSEEHTSELQSPYVI